MALNPAPGVGAVERRLEGLAYIASLYGLGKLMEPPLHGCLCSAMTLSVRSYIRKVLQDLTDDEFRSFKANLRDYPINPGYENILRGDLEKADALKLSDLLISYYNERYATEVAAAVLMAGNCMPQAQMLLRLLEGAQE